MKDEFLLKSAGFVFIILMAFIVFIYLTEWGEVVKNKCNLGGKTYECVVEDSEGCFKYVRRD